MINTHQELAEDNGVNEMSVLLGSFEYSAPVSLKLPPLAGPLWRCPQHGRQKESSTYNYKHYKFRISNKIKDFNLTHFKSSGGNFLVFFYFLRIKARICFRALLPATLE